MSRGPGAMQRFVLDRLSCELPPGEWRPWITAELLGAWYAGPAQGEIVSVYDDDGIWRSPVAALAKEGFAARPHLLGLSVDRSLDAVRSQHIPRAAIESARRAVKRLAAIGRVEIRWFSVRDRGAAYVNQLPGDEFEWISYGHVDMLACRGPLSTSQAAAEERYQQEARARGRAAMAMLKGL